MFGDFSQNFGLSFPFQGADPQGGLFGENTAPAFTDAKGGAGPTGPTATAPAAPIASPSTLGTSGGSPTLLAGPLAPGQTTPTPPTPSLGGQPDQQGTAPAAGLGSPFGKQTL